MAKAPAKKARGKPALPTLSSPDRVVYPDVGVTKRDVFEYYEAVAERPGSRIGPYRLMEQIGEGGLGLVFVAEQQQPVRRKVAIKIIKPGMDSRQVLARFEQERQALALMDHPNIARVLDAGATDSGRPYVVMELLAGPSLAQRLDSGPLEARSALWGGG